MLKRLMEKDNVVLEDVSTLDLLEMVVVMIIGLGFLTYYGFLAIGKFYTWLFDKLIPDIESKKEEAE